MQLGWRVFTYKKQVRSDKDAYSYCKIKLNEYSEKLFVDDTSSNSQSDCDELGGSSKASDHGKTGSISIYTSPSKTIEFLIINDWIEVRLFEWREKGTGLIILEKSSIKEVRYKANGHERTVAFTTHKNNCASGQFKVVFYKEDDKHAFLAYLADKAKSVDMESIDVRDLALKNFTDHVCIAKFVSKMNEMSSGEKSHVECASVEGFIKEMNAMSEL